ncbi:MAG: SIR2 family protein [Xanthobacteraceae bacterium]
MAERQPIDQKQITSLICARPQNFAWFLGAGASRSVGLPSATDILWDLKRQYYCREENQEITRQDIQNDAVRDRIQTFMESRGFPAEWAEEEYETYFEKIFGTDKEKQRRYVSSVLAEEKVRLASGHRVLGAMISMGSCRVVFTTNFDTVIEKAVAAMGGKSLAAYHLEGAHNAKQALDNEEYPFYCKLHGDFRYESLKNLAADLATQNTDLSQCLVNAGNRFGFVVVGYSGRDASVMDLFQSVLQTTNPFPHGLYWTYLKGSGLAPAVNKLLEAARMKGVKASAVPIETFDSMMMRIWRNLANKPKEMDIKVRRTAAVTVSIPLPGAGTGTPLLRMNALPVLTVPKKCLELSFASPKEWLDLRNTQRDKDLNAIFTKAEKVWCWGIENEIRGAFGADLTTVQERDVPGDLSAPGNLHVQGFVEEALCVALARERPLLSRKLRNGAYLIVDPQTTDAGALDSLFQVVGKSHGTVEGLFAPKTVEHPHPVKVTWAECLRLSLDYKEGHLWAQLDPDVWIWPQRAREAAVGFLSKRRGDRRNDKYNAILNAWIQIIFASNQRGMEIEVSAYDSGSDAANPKFKLNNRTAFARRLVA